MEKKEMSDELIERYLYDVVRHLPDKQKKDIEQELTSLIDDMVEERLESGTESRTAGIKAVLNKLGDPAKLARSYRGENACLIGGEYYDSYCFVLKIVLLCAGVGMLISNIVSAMIHVVAAEGITAGVWNDMAGIGAIPRVLLGLFGAITLVYAIMERKHVKIEMGEAVWTLEKLPQIPYKKAVISRVDSAFGLGFHVLMAVLVIFVPQLLGPWVKQDGVMVAVSVFNLSVWKQVLPLFLICITMGVIEELVKLVAGRYTYSVMIITLLSDAVCFGVTFILFKLFPVWNENFIPELEAALGYTINAKFDILTYFNTAAFTNGFLLFLLLCCILNTGVTVYRTVRYGEAKRKNG